MAENEVSTTKKKKMKPRGGNSPMIGMNGYNLEKGDNAKFLEKNVMLMNMPAIDRKDITQVEGRISEYFGMMMELDMKPTVSGLAMALGVNRRTLWSIANDQPMGGKGNYTTLPKPCTDCIKRAYHIMETLWEDYMQNGKINPVTGIFLAKNNYGYRDTTEHVLTPNQQEHEVDIASIKKRYILEEADEENHHD